MRKTILALLALAWVAALASAEEKAEAASPRKNATPLKVQVVFTRYQGDKKQTSLPYTISLAAPGRPARLRMGIEVPIPVVSRKEKEPTRSFEYRTVGTNFDCSADPQADGRYKLELSIDQSSLQDQDRKTPSDPELPFFRSFNASFTVVLGDGQTAAQVLGTDPVSGEVLKVEVSLTVLK